MRLTRTVVIGKQKDLVQRILYVLTYFLRCSELQENQLTWSGSPSEDDQVINGSKIVTALEKGEVEESEYVVVTVRNEPALVPPILPPGATERSSSEHTGVAEGPEGSSTSDRAHRPEKSRCKRPEQDSEASSMGFQEAEPDSLWAPQGIFCEGKQDDQEAALDGPSRPPSCDAPRTGVKVNQQTDPEDPHEEMLRKLADQSVAWPCPDRHSPEEPPVEKVTFHIGSSVSPESDFESRAKKMEERLKACGQFCGASSSAMSSVNSGLTQDQQDSMGPLQADSQKDIALPQDHSSRGEGVSADKDLRGSIVAHAVGQLSQVDGPLAPSSCAADSSLTPPEQTRDLQLKGKKGPSSEPVPNRCRQQGGLLGAADVPCGDASGKDDHRTEGDIPRNESLDSALGDSGDEACILALLELGHSCDRTEGSLEVELPLPR